MAATSTSEQAPPTKPLEPQARKGNSRYDLPVNEASAFAYAGANGGWGTVGTTSTGVGSQQTSFLTPDPTYGKADYVELASYQVTGAAPGVVTLTVSPASVSGFKFVETDKTAVFGTNVPVMITVIPVESQ